MLTLTLPPLTRATPRLAVCIASAAEEIFGIIKDVHRHRRLHVLGGEYHPGNRAVFHPGPVFRHIHRHQVVRSCPPIISRPGPGRCRWPAGCRCWRFERRRWRYGWNVGRENIFDLVDIDVRQFGRAETLFLVLLDVDPNLVLLPLDVFARHLDGIFKRNRFVLSHRHWGNGSAFDRE